MCLGIPGKIRAMHEQRGAKMGDVDFGGVVKEVCFEYVPEAEVGDYVIVHVGFAITVLDEQSAQETLELLRQTGALEEEFGTPEVHEGESP